jgi:5-methylcytosine-specific restriction endonuclease McrA
MAYEPVEKKVIRIGSCPICSEEFPIFSRRPTKKYCSKECQRLSQRLSHSPQPKRVVGIGSCRICGEEFSIFNTGVNRKHCSKECSAESVKAYHSGDMFVIFDRDGCRCIYCGSTPTNDGVKLSLDHVIPVASGGGHVAGNLVTACMKCNVAKSSKPLSDMTMRYVGEWVQGRNMELGIPSDKPIKGSHCTR